MPILPNLGGGARIVYALAGMGLAAWGLTAYVMHISLVLVVVWLFLAFVIAKRYMTLVKPQDT